MTPEDKMDRGHVTPEEHRELERRMAANEKSIVALTTAMDTLRQTVTTSYSEIKNLIGRLEEKQDHHGDRLSQAQQINWTTVTAMLTFAILTIGALGGFMYLHTAPIAEKTEANHVLLMERLKQLPEDYYQFGRNSANMEKLMDKSERIETRLFDEIEQAREDSAKRKSDIARLTSNLKALRDLVEDIDQYGSRKWVPTE